MSSATDYAAERGFPSFAPLFDTAPAQGVDIPLYLALLNHPSSTYARVTMRAVADAVAVSPDSNREVISLFAEVNWRPHLVGAMALLLGAKGLDGVEGTVTPDTLAALWGAFDGASWVSPQLAVTALLCDPAFEEHARVRVEAGCPINTDRLAGLDWVSRHSAAGPGSFAHHSSKALTALVTVCKRLSSAEPWLDRALADAAIQKIMEADLDRSDSLVNYWFKSVEEGVENART
jgi:hypothetical protein